jgi:Skp family chaperone for outer membrane proteins
VKRIIFLALALATTAGCASQPDSTVATIDLTRIQNNWPKFINYSNQLASDTASINRSTASQQQKQQELDELRKRYVSMQNEVTGDVRDAAAKVADERHIKLVVTRQFVGYGGIDITADVEKLLNIVETSPAKS